jgi:GAF domain-containing protein/HAMP domain-containing protein
MSNQPINLSQTKLESTRPTAWFDKFTYPQKFVLIALIFTLPIIAFLPLFVEQSTYIDRYGYKEAQGNTYLSNLWDLTNDLQSLQYDTSEYSAHISSFTIIEKSQTAVDVDFQNLEALKNQYNNSLALDSKIDDLQKQWVDLKATIKDQPNVSKIANLVSGVDQLTKSVGDSSYLILDPDLDTYYMMDTVLLKQPENQALLFQIFLITDEILHNQASTPEKEAELTSLLGRVETNLDLLDRNIQTALQNNPSGAMKPIVDIPRKNYISSTLSFVNLIKTKLQTGQLTQVSTQDLDAAHLEAVQTANVFYKGASKALDIGIQARINRLSTRLYTVSIIAILSVLIALSIGLITMRSISTPLVQLVSATERLAAGKMDVRVQITRHDEVGQVAHSFNLMAQELQTERSAIEARTRDLETARSQSDRRATQLQAITELSETISQLQDLNELFTAATNLISSRFNFYHVSIFLLDSEREYAIMQAANSEGGQRMLERGHRLKLGTGVVGFAAQTGQPRIALDVGDDAVFFDNPDLPTTRTEIALPMKARGETIGVLDVQSTQADTFSNEDLQVLTALANQVSIALENTRLLTETRAALAQVQEVYDEFTRAEWSRTAAKAEQSGFRYQTGRIELIEELINTPEVASAVKTGHAVRNQPNGSTEAQSTVAVPVKLRGEVIGILYIQANDPSRKWENDEVSLVEAVAERAAFAMENARLFQDARRRGAKERLISEATTKISGALNIENILQTTAQELERVLGGSEVLIKFKSDEKG